MVGVGVRKEVQRRDSCEAWQRAKLVHSDREGRDESMKGRSLRHEKLPTTRRSSTEVVVVDKNVCDLTHFWDLARRAGKPRMHRAVDSDVDVGQLTVHPTVEVVIEGRAG